jgi:hypothetical protein
MPEGNVDPLTKQELVDLVTFLSAVGLVPEFTVSTEPIIRSFETLIESPQALRALAVTSKDTVAAPHPDLVWRPVTAKVNGSIPMEELDSLKMHDDVPTCYVRFAIDLPNDGVAKLDLGTDEYLAWVDAKPTPASNLSSPGLSKGSHMVVLAFDRQQTTGPIVVRIVGDAK